MQYKEVAEKAVEISKKIWNLYNKDSLDLAKELFHIEQELETLNKTETPASSENLDYKKKGDEGKKSDSKKEEVEFPTL